MALDPVSVWVWDKYGKELTGKFLGLVKGQWDKFEWDRAAEKYRKRVKDLYSTTRMLGKSESTSLEGIFTDVYLLDRPTALQRFNLEELKTRHVEQGSFENNSKRLSALRLASQQSHLFILGKPGAGKTTFLKYLTLRAATGDLNRVPIFIALHEWASSGLELLPFIQRQFEICAFPDAGAFIQRLLKRGEALVCFDGLDEVNEADDKRAAITQAMRDLINQYPTNQYLITCRIAATDYTFEKFTYVEMADFTFDQVQVFTRKWFGRDEAKAKRFVDELSRDEHRGLRELAQTPLLLTLLCLNFEETLTFPTRRTELYEEALDALLKKWDSTRNIKRDEIYHGLSLGRRRQLLIQVSAEYFERGEIFFRQGDLAQRVSAFLRKLPGMEAADESDGLAVVKAVEAQHGIFVERAHRIYSFSHLTVQEYFTARYIVDRAADGALERLLMQHLSDSRWREVFLLITSLLLDADAFFAAFQRALDALLADDEVLLVYGRWAATKAADYAYLNHPAIARASAHSLDLDRDPGLARDPDFVLALNHDSAPNSDPALDPDYALARTLVHARTLAVDRALDRARLRAFDHVLARALNLDVDFARDLDLDLIHLWLFAELRLEGRVVKSVSALVRLCQRRKLTKLAQALIDLKVPSQKAAETEWDAFVANLRDLLIQHRNIGHEWNLTVEQQQRLSQYEQGTVFLAKCLQLAVVSDRKAIENRLLLPPER